MRSFNFAYDEYYHLYNRGVEKRKIFLTAYDYARFTTLLYISNGTRAVNLEEEGKLLSGLLSIDRGEPLVAIGAYCLMPNHFHVLVREKSKNGVSKFMQKVTTGYTMYFNKMNDRTGSLFQGTFKAQHASDDIYLKYLYAYIHLNPAKLVNARWREEGISAKDRRYVETYPHSSYMDYLKKKRTEEVLLSRQEFPDYFDESKAFKDEMHEWLDFASVDGLK